MGTMEAAFGRAADMTGGNAGGRLGKISEAMCPETIPDQSEDSEVSTDELRSQLEAAQQSLPGAIDMGGGAACNRTIKWLTDEIREREAGRRRRLMSESEQRQLLYAFGRRR